MAFTQLELGLFSNGLRFNPASNRSRIIPPGKRLRRGTYLNPQEFRRRRHFNNLELAGKWDVCLSWREKSPCHHGGSQVKVAEGPFVGDGGTVDALISETRIRR